MGRLLTIVMALLLAVAGRAQTDDAVVLDTVAIGHDVGTLLAPMDSLLQVDAAALAGDSTAMVSDSTSMMSANTHRMKVKHDWGTWRPNPQRALWLAMVIPGAGQIYNRKFWKLPIIYGGFIGCIYALTWNNQMYKDYSQAYLDIMDKDPATQSYNKFLHLGKKITSDNEDYYKEVFRKRKDKYRRWRDLSFFAMLGVYAVSVIDAYVDAELSVFDISKDLSLEVEPAVIPNHGGGSWLEAQSLGVSCKLNF